MSKLRDVDITLGGKFKGSNLREVLLDLSAKLEKVSKQVAKTAVKKPAEKKPAEKKPAEKKE